MTALLVFSSRTAFFLCAKYSTRIRLSPSGQTVKGQGIGKFSGTDAEYTFGFAVENPVEFGKQVADIDIVRYPRRIEIGLQDTVQTQSIGQFMPVLRT